MLEELGGGGQREKNRDNCNRIIKKIYLKRVLLIFKFNFRVDLLYISVCVSRLKALLIYFLNFTFFKKV